MKRIGRHAAAGLLLLFIHATVWARTWEERDTTRAAQVGIPAGSQGERRPWASPFDTLSKNDYSAGHSFSLDQFLEGIPTVILSRLGPIGAAASYSRYGVGMGRGQIYLAGVPLNDPQDDRVPIALVPTSALGDILIDGDGDFLSPGGSNIEGAIRIGRPAPPEKMPAVSLELAAGDRDLRQRRARFSSRRAATAIDIGFDELLNDGYPFDAEGVIGGPNFGKSSSRVRTFDLRGNLPDGERYLFSLRTFNSVFTGDLAGASREHRRSGFVGLLDASAGGTDLSIFERVYKVSAPDSFTVTQTTAAYAALPVVEGPQRTVTVGGGYEDIVSRQEIGGGESNRRLQKIAVGLDVRSRQIGGLDVRGSLTLGHYYRMRTGWGGWTTVGRPIGQKHRAWIEVRRGFRMPNLGELFLPLHDSGPGGTTRLIGNRYLGAETCLESTLGLGAVYGPLRYEMRASALRVDDPILPAQRTIGGQNYLIPENGATQDIRVLDGRLHLRESVRGTVFDISGGVVYAHGEQNGFFSGVPEWRAVTSASVRRSFFRNTSELGLTGNYRYTGSRGDRLGGSVSSHDVLDLVLDLRLVDAHLYVMLLNTFDAKYETVSSFLMTPRTFVYGVSWTLFD